MRFRAGITAGDTRLSTPGCRAGHCRIRVHGHEPAPRQHPELAADTSFAAAVEPQEEEDDGDPYAYPAWNGIDLDCPDVGRTVKVTGADPHRLDRDRDGWGCESY